MGIPLMRAIQGDHTIVVSSCREILSTSLARHYSRFPTRDGRFPGATAPVTVFLDTYDMHGHSKVRDAHDRIVQNFTKINDLLAQYGRTPITRNARRRVTEEVTFSYGLWSDVPLMSAILGVIRDYDNAILHMSLLEVTLKLRAQYNFFTNPGNGVVSFLFDYVHPDVLLDLWPGGRETLLENVVNCTRYPLFNGFAVYGGVSMVLNSHNEVGTLHQLSLDKVYGYQRSLQNSQFTYKNGHTTWGSWLGGLVGRDYVSATPFVKEVIEHTLWCVKPGDMRVVSV